MDMNSLGGLDLATYINSAMRNDDGFGSNGGLLWLFLLILLNGGRGFFGNAAETNDLVMKEMIDSAIQKARADGVSDDLLMQGINGNKEAISQIASALRCDFQAVNTALCGLDKAIALVAGEIGTTGERVINAVQAGNCDIISKIQNCCCDLKSTITAGFYGIEKSILEQNYQNRISNMEQTQTLTSLITSGVNQIGNRIDAQTLAMNAGFQGIKDYLCGEKIETLQHQVTQLENAANNAAQTAAVNAYVNAATAPIQAQVNQLLMRVPPQPVPTYPAPQFNCGYGCGCTTNSCGC